MKTSQTNEELEQIAIIGMAGRFAGAPTLKDFWNNLVSGVESVSFFSQDELLSAGIPGTLVADRRYVRAKAILEESDHFDARYFDFSAREAVVMDPQFRVFLETAVQAMEDAGYTGDESNRRTGIFAGSNSNTYQEYLRAHLDLIHSLGQLQTMILNERDFLPTWASYKLNLTGPCVTVQSACATALVAVHLASQSLLNGECDIALAGGVSLSFPQREGYLYIEGGAMSPDGCCRSFDAKGLGSVPGEGVGVVVLCRLGDALAQGDAVRAIIKASSINNDGSNKIGFLAPSEKGIATAVSESLAIGGVDCESIRYIEAHGSGTPLGDPIEIAALTKSFRAQTEKTQFCAIGSVKPNIGNVNTAAGAASLIKMVLALEHGIIPPSLHFEEPNPLIKFEKTPFYVNTRLEEWSRNGGPRRGSVNAFGLGGTNAHLILEEAPRTTLAQETREELLVLSARSEAALASASKNLAAHLEGSSNISLSSVAYTLGVGRHAHDHRRAVPCSSITDAVNKLRVGGSEGVDARGHELEEPSLVFVFRDRGYEHAGLGFDLYRNEAVFRQEVDRCAEILQPLVAGDIRALIHGNSDADSDPHQLLSSRAVSAGFSFAIQFALAELLASRGLNPDAVSGEGTGQYVAACFTGRLSNEEALMLAVRDATASEDSEQMAHMSFEFVRQVPAHDRPEVVPYADLHDLSESVLLEIGPPAICEGESEWSLNQRPIATMQHEWEPASGWEKLLNAVGQLWLRRVPVDWHSFYSNERRQRIPLPTYPFERRRYWVGESLADTNTPGADANRAADAEEWPEVTSAEKRDEPENDLEAVVAEVWGMFLSRDRIGMNDGFYELGGNSLVATRIVMTIRETLQIDLPVRAILEYPTLAGFVAEIERAARRLETDVHEIARVVREISALQPEQVENQLATVEAG